MLRLSEPSAFDSVLDCPMLPIHGGLFRQSTLLLVYSGSDIRMLFTSTSACQATCQSLSLLLLASNVQMNPWPISLVSSQQPDSSNIAMLPLTTNLESCNKMSHVYSHTSCNWSPLLLMDIVYFKQ